MQEKTKAHVMAAQRALASRLISIGVMLRISVCVAAVSLCGAAVSQPIIGSSSVSGSAPKLSADSSNRHSQKIQRLEVRGQQINFTKPAGYCALGNSEPEKFLLQHGNASHSLASLYSCDELSLYRENKRDSIARWIQINAASDKDLESTVESVRYKISSGYSIANIYDARRRIDEISRSHFRQKDAIFSVEIGTDGVAVYRFSASPNGWISGGESGDSLWFRNLFETKISGQILIKGVPLTISVMDSSTPDPKKMYSTLQEVIGGVIAEN